MAARLVVGLAAHVGAVGLQAQAVQDAGQAVIELLVANFQALQLAGGRVVRAVHVIHLAADGFAGDALLDIAVELVVEHGGVDGTGRREIPLQRGVDIVACHRFQIRIAARACRLHRFRRVDEGHARVQLGKAGAADGAARSEAADQVRAQLDFQGHARQHVGAGRVADDGRVDAILRTVALQALFGTHDAHAQGAVDGVGAQLEGDLGLGIDRVRFFRILEERARVHGARRAAARDGLTDGARVIEQEIGARRVPLLQAIVGAAAGHRFRQAIQTGNRRHALAAERERGAGHVRCFRIALETLDRFGFALDAAQADADFLEDAARARRVRQVGTHVVRAALVTAVAVEETLQIVVRRVLQIAARVVHVQGAVLIGIDTGIRHDGDGIEDRVAPVIRAPGAGHFRREPPFRIDIPQAAHGKLMCLRLVLVRLRRHDGVDVGGRERLQLVGAGNFGGRHRRAPPWQADKVIGLGVEQEARSHAFRVQFDVGVRAPLQHGIGRRAAAVALDWQQAHLVRPRQTGRQEAFIHGRGTESAFLVITVLLLRQAQQRAHFADARFPAVSHHAADVRVGGLGFVAVDGARIHAGREVLEIERAVGAHVDDAGHAAFDLVRALRLIDVHALQHGGGNVGQVDVAARGGEQFAAVEQGRDIAQAADHDGARFARIAADLDAGNARQGLGHVVVREFADVVGHDGVDDLVRAHLDLLRILRRTAHAADGHDGHFRRRLGTGIGHHRILRPHRSRAQQTDTGQCRNGCLQNEWTRGSGRERAGGVAHHESPDIVLIFFVSLACRSHARRLS